MRLDAMKLGLVLGVALTTTVGCGKGDDGDTYRDGVPYHEDVTLAFPGGSAAQQSALTADGTAATQGALLGEQAEFYRLTRGITVIVNTGTASVLGLIKTITEYPPTSVDKAADTAVWGPYTDALSPNTWRLTVNRIAQGQFHYVFAAKAKTAPDTAYVNVLVGNHNLADPMAHRRDHLPAYGSGNFVLDWDAAATLPEHDKNVGKAAFTYSRVSPTSEVDIDVAFTQVRDEDTGMLVDATYGYTAMPGNGGSFDFKLIKNMITTTPALETITVHSRWLETGAGRSDTQFTGGDVPATGATANECWDSNFLSVYMTNSYGDPTKMWGAETACAFTPAVYSQL
jgi:hypothetical protein